MPEVRPIDANTLKKELSELNYDMALRIVDVQPTIEPEVRHGDLIPPPANSKALYRCSECGVEICQMYTNYCGNCGVMLDGGADNG